MLAVYRSKKDLSSLRHSFGKSSVFFYYFDIIGTFCLQKSDFVLMKTAFFRFM